MPDRLSVRSNPDYLVFGNWIMAPDDPTGTNPFDYRRVDAVEGTADYLGAVVGTATLPNGDDTVSSRMTGNVSLKAQFVDQEQSGAIIDNMAASFFQDGRVQFLAADIAPAGDPAENFTFGTSEVHSRLILAEAGFGFANLNGLAGKWSGEFYGVSATGEKPGGIAGLFNATKTIRETPDQTLSINAAFGAYCFSGCGNF